MEEKLIRTIHPETRILDEEKGLVEYIASDESIDSYDEIILAKGWKFSRFKKNAPFVDSHDYWSIERLLGQVEAFRIDGKRLVETVRWAKDVAENGLARLGWKMTVAGFLKAVSVGFYPTKQAWRGDDGFPAAAKTAGLDTEGAAKVRRIFLEQEQVELSAVIIGANPNALAKAHQQGAVSDGDLAACGFADDDLEFLHGAAAACDAGRGEEAMRLMVAREMRAIFRRKAGSDHRNHPGTAPDPAATKRAEAAEVERRAAERREFLASLGKIAG